MKTAHQLARELLAGTDLPIYHFDPSRAGIDDDYDTSLSEPVVEKNDNREWMSAEEVSDGVNGDGIKVGEWLTICGDIDPEGEAMSDSESSIRRAAWALVSCSVSFANPVSGQQKRLVDEEFIEALIVALNGSKEGVVAK